MPVVGPASDIEAQPERLGAFHVTWYENGVAIDSEWLTREEYHDMLHWFKANGWDHEAKYVQRAHLSPEALSRLIKEY